MLAPIKKLDLVMCVAHLRFDRTIRNTRGELQYDVMTSVETAFIRA